MKINLVPFYFQDVDADEIKVQVCVYAFDLLYLNGEVSYERNIFHFVPFYFYIVYFICIL